METLDHVRTMIHHNDWMTSIDLRNAFFHVQMQHDEMKHLGFVALGQRWRFRTMPFGTSDAPYTFTKLDDLILVAPTRHEALKHTQWAVRLLQLLGFHINDEKSQLTPVQRIDHLGFELNTADNTIRLPHKKLHAIEKDARRVERAASADTLTIRQLAGLLGKLVAAAPAVPALMMRRHALQRDVDYCLRRARGRWDGRATLSRTTRRELRWLRSPALRRANHALLIVPPPDVTLTTDAGPDGYGAVLEYDGTVETTHAHWSEDERAWSSNLKETEAIVRGFFAFRHIIKHSTHLHIASDNTTALSYVRRQGGRLHHLARAAEPLTRAVHRWRVHLTSSHIPGEENGVADELSRRQHDRHDWALHPDAFALVERHYGAVEFDWFASSANAKHRRYATRRPDARAERVGAFRADWSQVAHNYWCPPTPLLARTVRKIADDGAHGVIIVPRWLAQVWWAPLARMMRATPLLLNSHVARPIVPSRAGHPMQNGVDPPMLAVLV
mmetsp:Transcript_5572/g.9350  ORF Transcript_5572/g.9350 Transcript_5572/m.9350 type:complete len:500 (+) Transcript_5572:1164-2663(+)